MVQTVMGETMAGNAPEVWVVDDDRSVRFVLATALREAGYRVSAFGDAGEALQALTDHRPPALVITDVRMPGDSGLVLLDKLKQARPNLPVIVMSAHTDVASTAGAFRGGAHEFLSKPFDLDEAVALARRALPQAEELATPAPPPMSGDEFPALVGDAPAMRALFRAIGRLAQAPLSVLVTGETGTGKELVARCLHEASPRSKGHFVAINCGGLPDTLFDSEMFGNEAGAFTGAGKRRIGKLEHASGGTLFLDEIESMPMAMQIKLLRVLQERVLERLGSNTLIPIDCRVVAATKVDLLDLCKQGKFREDLYYRLSIATVDLPPLRERREDVPLLFEHFLMLSAARHQLPVPELAPGQLQQLLGYHWPGNVRELRNVAERAVLGIAASAAPFAAKAGEGAEPAPVQALAAAVDAFERTLIAEALRQHGGNLTRTAEALRVPKTTLHDKIRRHGLGS